MNPTLDNETLKDKLASQLDIYELLNLLELSERELLDFLTDQIEEYKEECLAAIS